MSKKIGWIIALVGMCALSLFLLNCGSSSSRPSGVLYVLTQGANGQGNNVSSFSIDLDSGNLSLVNSNASTCSMPGTGTNPEPCGQPLDILLDPTGATAFVLNQGVPCILQGTECVGQPNNNPVSPSIYEYTVNSDGSLSMAGSTGITWIPNAYPDTAVAMTRDAAGQFLFVIDQGSYPPPGFPVAENPYPSCPHAPTAETDVCPSISVFMAQPGSTSLTLASGSPFYLSKIPTGISAIAVNPPGGTAEELLFVSNNEDICSQSCIPPSPNNDNTVSVYSVSSSGVLSEQPNSPYALAAPDPISVIAVNTNPGGNNGGVFIYVGNQGSTVGSLNPFQLCTVQNANCSASEVEENLLVPVTCAPQPSCSVTAGQNPIAMLVDPTNNFLYSIAEGSNQIFGFRINTAQGTLAGLNPANQPTGSEPVSLALHPSVNNTGQYLYISNSDSDNISGFTLSTTTGSMTNPITVIAPAPPTGMAVH